MRLFFNAVTQIFTDFKIRNVLNPDKDSFARIVKREEITANNYNLITARYIADKKTAQKTDSATLASDIQALENKLSRIDEEIKKLKEQLKIV